MLIKAKHFSFRRLGAALLSAMVFLPLNVCAQDFTPDLFPGQSKNRTELEVSATVNVGDFGQATNIKSWVQNLTSTNQNVVQTYNQNGYTAVLIVGVGTADVTYTETMFNDDETGGGVDGGTTEGVTTHHTIHYTVIKGAPLAQYTLDGKPAASARLFWDGENPYAYTFTPPSLEIVVKEVYLEQNTFPKFRDKYIYETQCDIVSTNPAVATAGPRGVSPVSFGKTTIRATWPGNDNWVGASAEYELSVEAPKQTVYVNFAQREVTGFVGDNMTAPMNVQMLTIDRWYSENPEVATVDATTGTVTFVSKGTTRIFAQVDETDEHYAAQGYYTVNVKKHDHELSFSKTELNGELGVPFTPPTLNNPHNLTIEKWYGNNPEVAEVNESTGEVTLKAEGTVTITCETLGNDTYEAGTASYMLYVTTIGIKVVGVNVTSLNSDDVLGDGQKQVTYDKTTNMLTLSGLNIQAQTLSYDIQKAVIVNNSPRTLQICLKGTNSIMNAVECIVSEKSPVVIMSDDKDNSLALTATTSAIHTNALKVYDSHLYASANTVAIKLSDMLSVYKGGYVKAETESNSVSAIECKHLERGMDDSGGIEILTAGVVFLNGMGFFTGEHQKDPAKVIEIGKIPTTPPADEETTIEFNVTDPDDNDAVVFSTSAKDTYNEETGQLEISTSLTDEQVAEALETLVPGSSAWVDLLPGSLVFDVPAGSGEILVKCLTLPGYTLNVKVEGEETISITQASLGWAKVTYNVSVPTHVVVYLHASSSASAPAQGIAYAKKAPESSTGAYIEAIVITPSGVPTSKNEIASLTLTVRHNGEDAMVQTFPATGFNEVVLDKKTSSLIIEKVEVETLGNVSDVAFVAALHNSDGNPSQDQWRNMPLTNLGDGHWVLDMSEGVELVENGMNNETKTFEFYVQGKNGTDDISYNNGGQNYKVTFTVGEGGESDWKVKYYKAETATISLMVNDETKNYTYNGDGIRTQFYGEQPGEVSNLVINGFSTWFIYNKEKGVTISDVILQYRVNTDEAEGQWKSLAGVQTGSEDIWNKEKEQTDHQLSYSASGLNVDVANGLTPGKNYVLEIKYQVYTGDGDYKTLAGSDMCFSFSVVNPDGIGNVKHSSAIGLRYNISGQRVTDGYKGIVLQNGKKILIK